MTGSGIQKLTGGGTHKEHGDLISLLLFFKIKESRLINEIITMQVWEFITAHIVAGNNKL
jgi:hypothetical protein